MSFLGEMFGGDAEAQAAERNRAEYAKYKDAGTAFLQGGLDKSLGALGTGYSGANTALGENKGIWSNYGTTANGALDKGLAGSLAALTSAKADYNPLDALAAKYGAGSTMLLNSLGVNGAGGNTAAVNAFQAGPGYNFALDQGNDAINRRRAAGGMMNSGNADIDAMKFGQGLANQEYGNWQTKLGSFAPLEAAATSGAATGRAAADTNMATANMTDGLTRAGIAGNVATGQSGANTGIATNLASLGTGQAGLYTTNASDMTNLYGTVASGNAAANNQEAAGKAAGMKNIIGVGTTLASMAMGMPPGSFGGGFGGLGGNSPGASSNFSGFNVTGLPGV